MKAAWANCLAKDPDVNFVSVWVDAGYRRPKRVCGALNPLMIRRKAFKEKPAKDSLKA